MILCVKVNRAQHSERTANQLVPLKLTEHNKTAVVYLLPMLLFLFLFYSFYTELIGSVGYFTSVFLFFLIILFIFCVCNIFIFFESSLLFLQFTLSLLLLISHMIK